jgi:uncharacterized protein (TIGR00266 family)
MYNIKKEEFMKSHEIDYKIIGTGIQGVEIELDPEEIVIAEAGTMNYMDSEISFKTKMGDGSNEKESIISNFFKAGKRILTGESLFLTHFKNEGTSKKKIAFAAPIPGEIIPIDLSKYSNFICQKNSFLCGAKGTKIDIALTNMSAGFFGGEGFILQKLYGDGMIFINACGGFIKKELNNDYIMVDTGSLIGFSGEIEFEIETIKSLKSMIFGGEGLFLSKLSGTGVVFIQTMPYNKFTETIFNNFDYSKLESNN